MAMKVGSFTAKALFCSVAMLSVTAAQAREVSGITIPEVVSVAGRTLQLNGMGVEKKWIFVKIYVIGLYLEKPTTDARVAITADEAKRMVVIMQRDVSHEQFVHAVETAIMQNSGSEMPSLRARLNRLERALPATKKGTRLEFTYLPGSGTSMRGPDQELTIPGMDFAEALFSVWLGPKPLNSGLKRALLSGQHHGTSSH